MRTEGPGRRAAPGPGVRGERWGGSSTGRTDVIRIGPLLFGFTSNKERSRETEAPHFPSLKTKAGLKIGARKHLIPMCQVNINILPALPWGVGGECLRTAAPGASQEASPLAVPRRPLRLARAGVCRHTSRVLGTLGIGAYRVLRDGCGLKNSLCRPPTPGGPGGWLGHPSLAALLPGHTSTAASKGQRTAKRRRQAWGQGAPPTGLPDGLADLPGALGQPQMLRLNLPHLSPWLRVRLASWSGGSLSPSQLLPHLRSQTCLLRTSLHDQPPLGICLLEDLDWEVIC